VAALTSVAAAAIGRERDLGLLEAGFAADAVLIGDALDVQAVWGAGVRLS
jgi:N-acetylglucosamine-6-phosphate deacetylase